MMAGPQRGAVLGPRRRSSPRQGPGIEDSTIGQHAVGSAMLEVLICVVLLSLVGVAVLGAMSTSAISATTFQDKAADLTWLSSVGDRLARVDPTDDDAPDDGYISCADQSTTAIVAAYQVQVDQLANARAGDSVVSVSGINFWNGSGFATACSAASGHLLQRVELELRDNTDVALQVVRRPPPVAGSGGWDYNQDSDGDGVRDEYPVARNPDLP